MHDGRGGWKGVCAVVAGRFVDEGMFASEEISKKLLTACRMLWLYMTLVLRNSGSDPGSRIDVPPERVEGKVILLGKWWIWFNQKQGRSW